MNRRLTLLILVAAALTAGGCSNDILAPSTGTIYGTLLWEDASPAAGIELMVEGTDHRAVTDKDGRFVINNVLAVNEEGMGKYYVIRGWTEKDGEDMGFIVTKFKVKGAQSYSIGTATVRPTGQAWGNIYLPDSEDHSGTTVVAMGTSLMTTTRADGSFVLDKLPPHDKYVLLCMRDGYATLMLITNKHRMDFAIEPYDSQKMAAVTMRPPPPGDDGTGM